VRFQADAKEHAMTGKLFGWVRVSLVAVLVCTMSGVLSADTIRVITATADVRLRADATSASLASIPVGTVIEDATRVGQYYRVTLPADANGFKRVGFVPAASVEVEMAAASVAGATRPEATAVQSRAASSGVSATAARAETVAVLAFDYGTITRWWSGTWPVGKGIADLTVDEMVNNSPMQVIQRAQLASVLGEIELSNSDMADISAAQAVKFGKLLGARYLLVGSITQFSFDEGEAGAGFGGSAIAGVTIRTSVASVRLTARLIDTSSGVVVASATGVGDKTKRSGGLAMRGNGYFSGVNMTSSKFLDSVLGEATRTAVKEMVAKLVASKDRRR
jgi:curli biogenesis system outer membrane secretion channel CsgG